VVIASRSAEKLRAASDWIGGAEWLRFDVSDEGSVADALRSAGQFDHVLVSSGSVAPGAVPGGSTVKAKAGFANKFWGAYHVAAHAGIATGGSLTLISGVFAERPQKGFVAASCVNAAVEALARALALELAPVRVNVVSPGLVDTPLWDGMTAEGKAAYFKQETARLPAPYVGRPEDIAALVVACMTNPMLTGSILVADSGRVLI
jgi:NAD(P)-dependent dehydrogenase (short-subunit alcohol dehydrogenase family)